MDEFESITEEGYQKYKRMIFRNSFYSDCGSYNFIVERLQGRESEGNITMTDFKKGYDSALRKYASEQIKKQTTIAPVAAPRESQTLLTIFPNTAPRLASP